MTVTVSCTVESSNSALIGARNPMVTLMSCTQGFGTPELEFHPVVRDGQFRHAIGAGPDVVVTNG